MTPDRFIQIPPSETLDWYSCYGGRFYCSRLLVPMDYRRPLHASPRNPSVAIAMLMLPGANHSTRADFSGSPVLLNPGGPGGPGVSFALSSAESIQRIIGEDHDIIGFDPRAIGETTPAANCFTFPSQGSDEPSEEDIIRGQFNRMQWQLAGDGVGIVNSSDVALELLDQASQGGCSAL